MRTATLLCTGALALATLASPSWAAATSRVQEDERRLTELEMWKEKFAAAGNSGTLKTFQKLQQALKASEAADVSAGRNSPQAIPPIPPLVKPSTTFHPPAGKIVYPDELSTAEKKAQVRAAVQWTWGAYRKYAMGADKLIFHTTGTPKDWGQYGLEKGALAGGKGGAPGATLVDALDVLHLMGFTAELAEVRDYIATHLNFDAKYGSKQLNGDLRGGGEVDTFEVIIRVLGGLLSAHALTKDTLYRDKAVELGDALLPAFPPGELPCATYVFATKLCTGRTQGTTLGQAGTMALEFRQLGAASGMSRFTDVAVSVENLLIKSAAKQEVPYLLPEQLVRATAEPAGGDVQVDGGADSYYEYLLKLWLQSGKTDDGLRAVYDSTITNLLDTTGGDFQGGTFVGRLTWPLTGDRGTLRKRIKPIGGHLSCFFPGMLALGTRGRDDANAARDLAFATGMMDTCWQFYAKSLSGLGGEYMSVASPTVKITNTENKLRPEVAESLLIMWRVTKNPEYRRRGWQMFSAFERFAKHKSGGYCAMTASSTLTPMCGRHNGDLGGQPSFWLAETLKYLYLLFEDDESVLSFDDWVFNTEAHPFPIHSGGVMGKLLQ